MSPSKPLTAGNEKILETHIHLITDRFLKKK